MPETPPWPGYDDQDIEQVLTRAKEELDPLLEQVQAMLKTVLAYEQEHQDRPEITGSLQDELDNVDDFTSRWTSRWESVFSAIR